MLWPSGKHSLAGLQGCGPEPAALAKYSDAVQKLYMKAKD